MMKNFVEAKTVKSWISDEKELAFIDVRETAQHTAGHPIFSISIPFSEFEINIEIYHRKRVSFYEFDALAYTGAKILEVQRTPSPNQTQRVL